MKKEINLHIAFWLVLILVSAISNWKHDFTLLDALVFELLFLPLKLVVVYLNWFYLIPRFLLREKYVPFSIVLVLLIVLLAICQRIFNLLLGYPYFFSEWIDLDHVHILKFNFIIRNSLLIALPVLLTTLWKVFLEWKEKKENNNRLEFEKREAQLQFLKSQINPHFLFNTLNNIYSHALEDSQKVPNLLLKLSDFLSFSLYESNTSLIPLEKELGMMRDVIDLEESRFEDRVVVETIVVGNIDNVTVPPLVLLPFVENAFKHGLQDETKKAFIKILLRRVNGQLYFKVENSKVSGFSDYNRKKGIGFRNIRKRLDLLYGRDYTLDIMDGKNKFIVELTIMLP